MMEIPQFTTDAITNVNVSLIGQKITRFITKIPQLHKRNFYAQISSSRFYRATFLIQAKLYFCNVHFLAIFRCICDQYVYNGGVIAFWRSYIEKTKFPFPFTMNGI